MIEFSANLKKRESILQSAVEEYATAFETIVRKYPLQWFNCYNFRESRNPESILPERTA